MSKHNYSQYSHKKNNKYENEIPENESIIENEVVTDVVETAAPEVKMEVKPEVKPKKIKGTVANCAKLNVRANPDPNANVIWVLDAGSEVEIDKNESTKDWLCISTAAGVDGYCMRKFVNAKL